MTRILFKILAFAAIVSLTSCGDKTPVGIDQTLEIVITGDGNPTIVFPNPVNGTSDGYVNAVLPKNIIYFNSTKDEILITARKNQVGGNVKLVARLNDKVIGESATSAPFGRVDFTVDLNTRMASGTITEPEEWFCGTLNGNKLITGKKGGCYYLDASNKRVDVNGSNCSCK